MYRKNKSEIKRLLTKYYLLNKVRMGLLVGPTYTTDQGFVIEWMYLSVNSFRYLTTLDGSNLTSLYICSGYKSRDDMVNGIAPVTLPNYLCTAETVVSPSDFYSQTPYEMAYSNFSNIWTSAGYEVQNSLEPGQPPLYTYIFDSNGYDFRGFNKNGVNAQGYNRLGFNAQGYNAEGYNAQGFNAQGYNAQGFNAKGYNAQGYNSMGFNAKGFNVDGYNMQGVDKDGNSRPPLNPVLTPPTQ
jgi:hypothetical protein